MDVNIKPVGLVNTKISTGYAQKSPRTLLLTATSNTRLRARD